MANNNLNLPKVDPRAFVDISGRTWNKVRSSLNYGAANYRTPPKTFEQSLTVFIENNTGRNLKAGDFIEIGDALPAPTGTEDDDSAYIFSNLFVGDSTSESTKQFGVVIDGVSSDLDSPVEVAVTGITTANVNIVDADHTFARPSSTDGQWESTFCPTNTRIQFNPGVGNGDLAKVQLNFSVPTVFIVQMEQTGGTQGNSTTQASWTYTLTDLDGNELETGFSPIGGDNIHTRQPLGEVEPATGGLAFCTSDGDVAMYHCNEEGLVEAC